MTTTYAVSVFGELQRQGKSKKLFLMLLKGNLDKSLKEFWIIFWYLGHKTSRALTQQVYVSSSHLLEYQQWLINYRRIIRGHKVYTHNAVVLNFKKS